MKKEDIIRLLSSSEEPDNEQIIKALLSRIGSERGERQIVDIEKHISNLKTYVEKYNEAVTFKVGDIVQWKEGLKNIRLPQYDEPCVVIEVLKEPIFDKEAPLASPYYGEKLDLKLGLLGDNGEFFTFHYDKNRFTQKKYFSL